MMAHPAVLDRLQGREEPKGDAAGTADRDAESHARRASCREYVDDHVAKLMGGYRGIASAAEPGARVATVKSP